MTPQKILKALKNGRELVVIAQDEYCDSAIHNITRDAKKWVRYAREFGEIITPLDEKEFYNFIKEMQQENATLILRGCPYNER